MDSRYKTVFLPLWLGMVLLYSGLILHDVAVAWEIAHRDGSNALISLAQSAATLPFFLFALPAGALADRVAPFRVITCVALALAATSAVLGLSVAAGVATIPFLLLASLAMGTGNALFVPAWQSMVPVIVPSQQLTKALALNSLGVNIARSAGPILAGAALWASGASLGFAANVVFFLAVALLFAFWPQPETKPHGHREALWPMLVDGLRYVRHDRGLQNVSLRAACFFGIIGVQSALLPALVLEHFNGGGLSLGMLVGALGAGAIIAFLTLDRMRKLGLDNLMTLVGCAAALLLAAMPFAPSAIVLAVIMVGLGFCWLVSFSSIHVSAQMRLAPWMRARGTAIYMMAIYGSLAVGSALFGVLADFVGLTWTYVTAGVVLFATSLLGRQLAIAVTGPLEFKPSLILSRASPLEMEGEGVQVVVSYKPAENRNADVIRGVASLRSARIRSGAVSWASAIAEGVVTESIRYRQAALFPQSIARHRASDLAIEQKVLDAIVGVPEITVKSGVTATPIALDRP